MVKKLVSVALLAGLLSGIGATVFQTIYVLPLIHEAESFEVAEPVAVAAALHDGHDHGHDHGHAHGGEEAWAPEDGIQRTVATAGVNLFAGMGFALLLVAAIHVRGGGVNARSGLIWGGAGFVSFSLAPFFGLPPELPGMTAATLESRQLWWVATVALTAGGLWVMTSRSGILSTPMKLAFGLLLIVAPHAYGSPQLAEGATLASAVPAHLSAEFAVAALAHGLIFWLLIGVAAGWLCQRLNIAEGGRFAGPVPNQG
ncbi:CbtA family protein [Antarctobacter sp.]|uniref:CbtA family protein n=1 Tax=Antarctobacter sp. TaxID=1872577 RepID=UPI002B277C57|nr:CbtA family protein [Antarctobacter sp.]